MERIAKFELVSKEQWLKDYTAIFGESEAVRKDAEKAYAELKLPKRATAGSAGYDIYCPVNIVLSAGQGMKIPTGIRVRMREGYALMIVPRSGLGSRYRFQLDNTVGVIDSDYYHSENSGHIFVPMINDSRNGKQLDLRAGTAFVQGVFIPFGITEDDEASGVRTGGFGSTGI